MLLGLAPQFFAARAGKPVRALFEHLADRAVVVRRLLPDNRQAAYIARRNEHGLAYLRAACGKLSADKAAEAVPHRVNSVLVEAELFVAQDKVERGVRVLKVVRERVVAVAAPAAAVMKAQHVKARPAEVLREVIVFFAAGDAVEQQHCRVRALPCRRVQHGQQPAAFSLYQHAVDVRAAGSRAVMRFAVLKFLLHRVLLCQSAVSTAFSSLCLLRFFLYQSLP